MKKYGHDNETKDLWARHLTCRHLWKLAVRKVDADRITTRQRCEVCHSLRIGTLELIGGKVSGAMTFKVHPPELEPK